MMLLYIFNFNIHIKCVLRVHNVKVNGVNSRRLYTKRICTSTLADNSFFSSSFSFSMPHIRNVLLYIDGIVRYLMHIHQNHSDYLLVYLYMILLFEGVFRLLFAFYQAWQRCENQRKLDSEWACMLYGTK